MDYQNAIIEFKNFMASHGIETTENIVGDGQRHRFHIVGDKPGTINGWYKLHIDDRPVGTFGSWKAPDQWQTWVSQDKKKLSGVEFKKLQEKINQQKKENDLEQKKIHDEAAQNAQAIWDASKPAKKHDYLTKKGIEGHNIRISSRGDLVIPARSSDGQLHTLQFIDATGVKKFLPGGKIKGCYATLVSKNSDLSTICVCEGYATGASIFKATQFPVAVAFNAGNLSLVTEAIRKKYPNVLIVICADNDQWTLEPIKNPGIHYATEAATKFGGVIALPMFSDLSNKPTDFNDLYLLEGIEKVKKAIDLALLPTPDSYVPSDDYDKIEENPPEDLHTEEISTPYRPLGCGVDQSYYYLKSSLNQVVALTASQHGRSGLLHLAPLRYWEGTFHGHTKTATVNWDAAADHLMRECEIKGIFSPSHIRGRGTWHDEGRIVLHLGDRVHIDGKSLTPRNVKSKYVYEEAPALALDVKKPLPAKDAVELFKIMKLVPWSESSARLASGWIMCAHIGGALRWRPHIWVTGPKGSGKSWVMSDIIQPALGDNMTFIVSESTEAGIRQLLGNDAMPVLFDEAEGEDKRATDRIQRVLALARQASCETGAKIAKGTVGGRALTFQIRSCFAMSSITASLKQEADRSRFCVLDVDRSKYQDRFSELKEAVTKTLTPEFSRRLFARAVSLADTIRDNAGVFSEAVAQILNDRRAGDQYGALLAGNYALHSSKRITLDAAIAWMADQNWTLEAKEEVQGMSDEHKCLNHLMHSKIRTDKGEASIGAIIEIAINGEQEKELSEELRSFGLGHIYARFILNTHGIKIHKGHRFIDIARTHPELSKLFTETPYASDWGSVLKRLPNASVTAGQSFGARGTQSRSVRIFV